MVARVDQRAIGIANIWSNILSNNNNTKINTLGLCRQTIVGLPLTFLHHILVFILVAKVLIIVSGLEFSAEFFHHFYRKWRNVIQTNTTRLEWSYRGLLIPLSIWKKTLECRRSLSLQEKSFHRIILQATIFGTTRRKKSPCLWTYLASYLATIIAHFGEWFSHTFDWLLFFVITHKIISQPWIEINFSTKEKNKI